MKKLPVGQQDFEKLILKDCVYVDKTAYIHQMMMSGGDSFFLSRPRRFGKSLFLSTIKAIFEGKKELFNGLFIEDKIDWETYPVIKLDMTKSATSVERLETSLAVNLRTLGQFHSIQLADTNDPAVLLEQLIWLLFLKTGKQVVVLVDEYDKPILDAIHDVKKADEIRAVLQTFYGALKASAASLKFLLVTGITKISQTSIFSGFNNLNDISFDGAYAGICGYTQPELEKNFGEYILKTSETNAVTREETLASIKQWYNGYSWDAQTFVYNPFSVLLLLDKGRYNPFWYSSGTPTFLLKLLKIDEDLRKLLEGEFIRVPETFTEGQDLPSLSSITLLFQSGYLTIKEFDRKAGRYELQLPNEEVKKAIAELLLVDASKKEYHPKYA